jgi:hypothetical protein
MELLMGAFQFGGSILQMSTFLGNLRLCYLVSLNFEGDS